MSKELEMAAPSFLSLEYLTKQTEVMVDLPTLNRDLALHPGRYAMWAWTEVDVRHRVKELKRGMAEIDRQLRETDARLYAVCTAQLKAAGDVKPTVEAIKSAVAVHPEHKRVEDRRTDMQAQIDRAEHMAEQLKVGRDTMRDQKDSLMEIARNLRQEMDAGHSGRSVYTPEAHNARVQDARMRERLMLLRRNAGKQKKKG